ncbi:MAG: endonuclease/exonuclease/phosphatase family protein [Acidobacteriota bacterium]
MRDKLGILAVGLWLLLGLQLLRMLLPLLTFLLRDRLDWPTPAIGVLALTLFASGFVGEPLRRWLGEPRRLAVALGLLALGRGGAQLWTGDPLGDLVLGALGFVGFALVVPSRLAHELALRAGLVLGLAADLVLHTLAGSWDWAWRADGLALVVSLAPCTVLALLLVRGFAGVSADAEAAEQRAAGDRGERRSLAASSTLGPLVYLTLVLLGNPARLLARTGIDGLVLASLALLGAITCGVWASAVPSAAKRASFRFADIVTVTVSLVTLAAVVASRLPSVDGTAQLAATLAAAAGIAWLLGRALAVSVPGNYESTDRGHALGLLGCAVLLFVDASRFDLGLVHPVVMPALAVLWLGRAAWLGASPSVEPASAATASTGTADDVAASRRSRHAGAAGLPVAPAAHGVLVAGPALLALPLLVAWMAAADRHPSGDPSSSWPTEATGGALRVATYNLHCGVDPRGALDLEAQARTIEQLDADVVALQEVPRGWLVTGGVDAAGWLARRLGMEVVFAGHDDPLWGDAVLSALPIRASRHRPLPSDGLRIRRGLLEVRVTPPGGEEVVVVATHLHHPAAAGAARRPQVEALVAHWAGRPRTILAGDFNAEPEWPELAPLHRAGLLDAASVFARTTGDMPDETYSSWQPAYRIDYLWLSPDWTLVDLAVPSSPASDHLPIVAELALGPASADD